jgi:hypothetical protein
MDYETFKLNNRLKRLERLVYEKTVGRGNNDSRAYTIWKYLRDNGPKTRPEIRNALGYTTPIVEMEQENCVFKNGNLYSYNPDYNWEDVGVIPRTAAQELSMQMRNADLDNAEDDANDQQLSPTATTTRNTRSTRTPRAPRQSREPRARSIMPNLFSRKFDEVKAAVDAGEDVKKLDDKGRTPLAWACSDPKGTSGPVIRYLLEHGADPHDHVGRLPCIFATLRHNNLDGTRALLEKDNNLTAVYYNKMYPFTQAIDLGITDADLLASLAPSGNRRFNRDVLVSLEDLFKKLYIVGKISDDGYSNILRRIFYGADTLKSAADYNLVQYLISLELQFNKHNLYDIFLENGILPTLADSKLLERCSRPIQEHLYNAYKDAGEGKISFGKRISNYISDAITISKVLNKPYDFIYNFISREWVNNPDNVYALQELIDDGIYNDRIDVLKAIAKNITTADNSVISHIINMLCSNYNKLNREQSSYLCRILNKVMPDNYNFTDWDMAIIAERGNPYFIEFLFDHPSINGLLNQIKSKPQFARALRDNPNRYSNFIKALNDSGRTVDELVKAAENQPEPNIEQEFNDRFIKDIVECIYRDEWERRLDTFLRDNPEVLYDERIEDALDDPKNADSVTANRIRNMISRLPQNIKDKHTPKYDF